MRVALAPFLSGCPGVVTLGVRPRMADYTEAEREMMRGAERVFFPTRLHAEVFAAAGVPTFPSAACYRLLASRVAQELLFQTLDCPRPRARIFYGRERGAGLRGFSGPVLLLPDAPSRGGVIASGGAGGLPREALGWNPLIVRETPGLTAIVDVVCLSGECVAVLPAGALCGPREALDPGDFSGAVALAGGLAGAAALDDVSVRAGCSAGRWLVLGLGRPPRSWRGRCGAPVSRHAMICALIASGRL